MSIFDITVVMKLALISFCGIIPHCHLRSRVPFVLQDIKINYLSESFVVRYK